MSGEGPGPCNRTREAYWNAGGPKGSAGIFSGGILMASAGDEVSAQTWSVVQHEGFHQFAKAVIRTAPSSNGSSYRKLLGEQMMPLSTSHGSAGLAYRNEGMLL